MSSWELETAGFATGDVGWDVECAALRISMVASVFVGVVDGGSAGACALAGAAAVLCACADATLARSTSLPRCSAAGLRVAAAGFLAAGLKVAAFLPFADFGAGFLAGIRRSSKACAL
jgi:hypothetical protein